VISLGIALSARADEKPKGIAFFEKKIRPVLLKHCYACHSAKSKKIRGGLLLDTRQGIRKGGESGAAVVPGKPEASLLIAAIKYEDFEMPPKGKLPKSVVKDFVSWVKMGAPDPRRTKSPAKTSRAIDFKKSRQFWSLRPIRKPTPPRLKNDKTSTAPIDRFIRSALEKNEIQPSPSAKKITLLRRLFFDLVGLPPKPKEIERFLADSSPGAYGKLVDRLLASKHFGEKWGRHWLDVARFAESSGGGRTQVYHLAWRFRDYLIKSYNDDKPFDQFVREQIAGDLLDYKTIPQRREQLIATGFLMLGPTNYELQDKEQLRMEVIDEQLDTIGRAFLGMTIGCARCHDHKFDPIPQEDYYAMVGIMRSTHILTPGNVSGYLKRGLPLSLKHARFLADYERTTNPIKDRIAQIQDQLNRLKTEKSGLIRKGIAKMALAGTVLDDNDAKFTGLWSRSSSVKPYLGTGYRYSNGKNARVTFEIMVPKTNRYEVRLAYSAHPNRARRASISIQHADGVSQQTIDQRKQPDIHGLFVSLGTYRFEQGKKALIQLTAKNAAGTVIADGVQLLSKEEANRLVKQNPLPAQRNTKMNSLVKKISQGTIQLHRFQAELKEQQKKKPAQAPLAMAVEDKQITGDYFLCVRGNVHKLGEKVPRGFLQVLPGGLKPEIANGSSGRKELAAWLTDRRNPLTARVAVNRIWHHLFGKGIVRTVDNFGTMGEKPSHPKLLDWLARRFVEDGWSTKKTIRRIVLSQTYRQNSRFRQSANRKDPENRLLWRQNRRRLDAELIRDAILSVSGQLDLTSGGPTIAKKVNSEFGFRYTSLRRSVYVPAFRNTLHPLLQVFDIADPNLVTGRRNSSTLPTQALYLMNSPFVMEQAGYAAERLLSWKLPDDSTRLERMYLKALGRSPTKKERDLSLNYLHQSKTESRRQSWSHLIQALFASLDFRYLE